MSVYYAYSRSMMNDDINVRAIRDAYGLTQEGLASLLGVNVSTVWRWENGNPPKGAARALLSRMREEAPEAAE